MEEEQRSYNHIGNGRDSGYEEAHLRHLAAIVESSDDSIISRSLDGNIISWNRGSERIYGYSASHAVGKYISFIIPQPYLKEEERILEKISHGENIAPYETIRVGKSGEQIHVSITASPLRDQTGNVIGFSEIARDITSHKESNAAQLQSVNELTLQYEERVKEIQHYKQIIDEFSALAIATIPSYSTPGKEIEEKLHNTFDHMLEGIQIHDFNWRYTYVNDALVSYSQHTKDELLGNTLMDKYPGIENSDLFKVLQRCMNDRVSEHFETEFVFPNGSKADFELSIQPVPAGLFILSINISDRKKAEAKQRTIETHYRSVIEQANDTIYIVDGSASAKFLDINQSGCALLGYTKEEVLQLSVFDIIFENDFGNSASTLEDLKAGRPIRKERKLKRKDGNAIEAELSAKKMEDGNIIVVVRDISDRKKSEMALQKSEQRFRSLIENSKDVISLMDGNFNVFYRSPSAFRITGWTDEEVGMGGVTKHVHQDDLDGVRESMKYLISNPGKSVNTLFRNLHKNGNYVWLEGTAINLLHDDNVKAIIFNFRDISQQKEAEERLKLNEQYYRSIFEQANDMIYIKDGPDPKRFIDINPSGCQMLGYTKEEFLALKPTDLILKEDPKSIPIKLEQLNFGDVVRHERRLRRKDGTVIETEYNGKVLEDGNLIVFARDITARKKAEKEIIALNEDLERKVIERTLELENIIAELRDSEEKFQAAFQSNAAGISITRLSDSNYMDVNDAFVQLTGFSKEELINHNSRELGMIINIDSRNEILNEIRERGFAKNFEMTLRHKSGKEFVILGAVETIVLKGEKAALNILYDITSRKMAEEQLASVNKELEAFSYSVSHDLRAPLRAINGYAQMLTEDYGHQFDAEGKRLVQNITYNATKMGNLIDDLLAFSKLGRKEIQKVTIDLKGMLEEIISEIKKITNCKTSIKIGNLHQVKADYGLIYQVIFNLVSNGVKYSSKNENSTVEISSELNNFETIISVIDNGAGFDMKYADKLFGVFQRLHSQEEFEGTGVGLAIVQRIVAKHSGRVWAEGKINEGAVFRFSLPNY